MRVGVECGQRWWRPRSWTTGTLLRRFSGGFAVGPVMVWKATPEKES